MTYATISTISWGCGRLTVSTINESNFGPIFQINPYGHRGTSQGTEGTRPGMTLG
jgi:hypothetical protein